MHKHLYRRRIVSFRFTKKTILQIKKIIGLLPVLLNVLERIEGAFKTSIYMAISISKLECLHFKRKPFSWARVSLLMVLSSISVNRWLIYAPYRSRMCCRAFFCEWSNDFLVSELVNFHQLWIRTLPLSYSLYLQVHDFFGEISHTSNISVTTFRQCS